MVVIAMFGLFLFFLFCIMPVYNCWAYSSHDFYRLFNRPSCLNW